jgi:hypothetical protein
VCTLILCGCVFGGIHVTPSTNDSGQKIEVSKTDVATNDQGVVSTNTATKVIDLGKMAEGIEAALVAFGLPGWAAGVSAVFPIAFGLYRFWYYRKVKKLSSECKSKFKLGKLAPIRDRRTLKLTSAFDPILPPIPEEFDLDKDNRIPVPMFKNDVLGCCVVAKKAHMTRRFEMRETGKLPEISDKTIERDYFRQTGGQENGLVLLLSLQDWRMGWVLDDGNTYTIDAFGILPPKNRDAVRAAAYLLGGLDCGLELPQSAMDQFERGEEWAVCKNAFWKPSCAKGSAGGHNVTLIPVVTKRGICCITWGRYHFMTWEFLAKYTSEVYGVIDSIDSWIDKPGFNPEVLKEYLSKLRRKKAE